MEVSEEALAEFIGECDEIIAQVTKGIASLEDQSVSPEQASETINDVYRHMHSLKGAAYLFGFQKIGEVAHAMESSLSPLRANPRTLPKDFLDIIFQALSLIEKLRGLIAEKKSDVDGAAEAEQLIHRLFEVAVHTFGESTELINDHLGVSEDAKLNEEFLQNASVQVAEEPAPEAPAEKPVESPKADPVAPGPESKKETKEKKVEMSQNNPDQAKKVADKGESTGSSSGETIRVQVELLDRLMNLVGELVLVRNQVLQFTQQFEDLELLTLSQNLNVVTSDLQEEIMKTRMQPIGNILNKYQRVIRDIASDLGKDINLTLSGAETELDKTLLEAIKDPLTHIIRNSCDHGIETPEVRKESGKSEKGQVSINSFHEGGQVVIEIEDDGKGLDRDRILAKAVEKGLVSEERGDGLPDREVFNMIFKPGFSTAQKVSSVSGRGVGMDVVKTNIERIGGSVELNSQLGKGSTTRLKIPLTLAIVPAMIVRAGEQKFCIPQVKLVELVRVENDSETGDHIELLQGQPVYRLRGDLLPLVSLREVLSGKKQEEETRRILSEDSINIVVLNAEGKFFGMVVDEVLDTVDIVVKPLGQILKELHIFSGATIMGDGSVSLILDVTGVAKKAEVGLEVMENDSNQIGMAADGSVQSAYERQEFLLFSLGGEAQGKFAMPVCLVHRLEEFDSSIIEYSGEQPVVQYRGSILPIISLKKILGFSGEEGDVEVASQTIPVIVTQKSGRVFGIEVQTIFDVVDVAANVDDSLRDRPGLLGNIVVDEELVVVVDIFAIIDKVIEGMVGSKTDKKLGLAEEKKVVRGGKILYAEDTAFFRKQVARVLVGAGYEVETANDGQLALERLEKAEPGEFQLLLSDIEMPKMNGFELAEAIRKHKELHSIPMLAVTTRFGDKDIKRGKEAGFNDYMEKLDPEKLIKTIDHLLGA